MNWLRVTPDGIARLGGDSFPCALGRGGIRADKHEGDGATPVGRFALRRAFYRPDRIARPATRLPLHPILPVHGWSDAPESACYNRQIRLPARRPHRQANQLPAGHPARFSHERLHRPDALYDMVITIGHNDRPTRPGRGSAVFIHVARPDFAPTEGCVAFPPEIMAEILARMGPGDGIEISARA